MKAESAAALSRAIDELDAEHAVRTDYSGRGMYGRTTHAVVCDVNTLVAAAAIAGRDLAFCVADAGNREATKEEAAATQSLADFIADLRELRVDDMGRSTVVY